MLAASTSPRLAAPILLGLLAAACADGGTPAVAALNRPGGEIVLAVGQSATPDSTGLTISFESVSGDSRCPARVQCIQAGTATVALRLEKAGTSHPVELQTLGHPTAEFGSYRLTIVELTPQPEAGAIPTPQASYRLRLKLERSQN